MINWFPHLLGSSPILLIFYPPLHGSSFRVSSSSKLSSGGSATRRMLTNKSKNQAEACNKQRIHLRESASRQHSFEETSQRRGHYVQFDRPGNQTPDLGTTGNVFSKYANQPFIVPQLCFMTPYLLLWRSWPDKDRALWPWHWYGKAEHRDPRSVRTWGFYTTVPHLSTRGVIPGTKWSWPNPISKPMTDQS